AEPKSTPAGVSPASRPPRMNVVPIALAAGMLVGLLGVVLLSTRAQPDLPFSAPVVEATPAPVEDGCPPGVPPTFSPGFGALRAAVGDAMGEALTCERYGPEGDALQQTSTGLARYRKAANVPTFTRGSEHWALTERGLVHWTGGGLDPPPAMVTA